MTTIRQLIQTSPARANELFAKLVDTSDTAIKTRDRLLSELKIELDLQAKLEEQHLFPVLKKHEETKGLVADALNDNRQTRKLMAELELTPKDSESFSARVAELKKVFQQHVRDDKKEFLPAVLRALSDEEAGTLVEKIENEKADIEAAHRVEADERRAEAKRERGEVEAAKVAEDKAKADAERARKDKKAAKAKASARARESKIEADRVKAALRVKSKRATAVLKTEAADIANARAEVVRQKAKVVRMVNRSVGTAAIGTSKSFRAAIGSSATLEAGRETAPALPGLTMVALLNEQARHTMQTALAVGRARTPLELTVAHSDFMGGSFQRLAQFNERYFAFVSGLKAFALVPASHR